MVVPTLASTEIVNAVRWPSVLSAPATISGSWSSSSRRALHRQADHAARVADHERHLVGRHLIGRDDEIALVLAVLVVDDHHELTALEPRRWLARLRRMSSVSLPLGRASVASTYLAIRSTSRFTRVPGGAVPSVVTASVCGISATANASSSRPRDGEAHAVDGDRSLVHDVAQHFGGRLDRDRARSRRAAARAVATVPVASTWPCTRWPPSRSARRTGRSRFTRVAGGEVAEVGAGERLDHRVGRPRGRRRARRP